MLLPNKPAGWFVLELGGGGSPDPAADVRVDDAQNYRAGVTSFAVDLSKPEWPEIGPDAFDAVLAPALSDRTNDHAVADFLRESLRVLKPGGVGYFVARNADAVGMGALNLNPSSAARLFAQAGFRDLVITPHGPDRCSILVEARKPGANPTSPPQNEPQPPLMTFTGVLNDTATTTPGVVPHATVVVGQPAPHKPAKDVYNFAYFNSYQGGSFYWDHPHNEPVARKVLELSPASVLELGCARGYVIKRLQDRGVRVQGLDVSAHAWLTRVTDPVNTHDLTEAPWPVGKQEFDLALSLSLLEHIPEDKLPQFMEELGRVSRRGLHGVSLEGYAPNHDPTRLTLKSLDWWKRIMPPDHEVVDVREFLLAPVGSLQLPPDYVQGDGKTKLNLGCAWTMFYGWENVDVVDAENFARNFGYRFRRHDLRQGVPWQTGVVDSIFSHHFLEHLTQEEGLRFLKDCRRVIRPDGAMRLAVPNTAVLAQNYHAGQLGKYDEMNEGCAGAKTQAGKLYSILAHEHKTFYDWETLAGVLEEAGWTAYRATFRQCDVRCAGVLAGTTEMDYGGESLFVDAIPKVG